MILRDHRQEDLESHHALLSDPEVMYYLPDIMTHSREESLKDLMISVEAIAAQPRKEYFLRMEDKETGELIGETGYTVLEETPAGKLVHLSLIHIFSGDTVVTWESLRFQPYFTSTASNIGYGWWSHDIGGHMNGFKDVYKRQELYHKNS